MLMEIPSSLCWQPAGEHGGPCFFQSAMSLTSWLSHEWLMKMLLKYIHDCIFKILVFQNSIFVSESLSIVI